MRIFFRKNRLTIAAALLLEVIMIAQVALSTRHLSLSWDEGDHIYAGYMNWKHGEYDLNPEHPPLVKLVATLPLLGLPLKTAPRQGRYFKAESYYGGRELLFRNGPDSGGKYTGDALVFRTHMAVMVFSLGVALLLLIAGWEMFGPVAGLIAMALWVFDPTVLANAPFVTTDTGAAFGFFASVYTFFRYMRQMTWKRMAVCGFAVGVALACKHNTVLLLPILLLLAGGDVLASWRGERKWPGRRCVRLCIGMAGISAIALTLLWGVYSFRFAMHPMGVSMPSLASEITGLSPVMSRVVGICARFHLLPESYLYGLVDVVNVGDYMPTYIFGKLYAHGQWFYFPAILSLKWTEGVLGLLLIAIFAFAFGKTDRTRQVFFMALPAIFYLGVAMASPLNIGVRHVLPVFPFVFVLIGGGTAWLISKNRVWAWPVGALLLLHIAASVRMFPNYIPYANVFWGGPAQTHLYFSDSAVEWGQDLKFVKSWTDQHQVKECWIAHFPAPFLLPSDYGVPCKLLPTLDTMYEEDIELPPVLHGPLLISFGDLNGFEFGTKVLNPYQSLFERKPDEVIANGVAVYYGDFSLPAAAALKFIEDSRSELRKNPAGALSSAREAVALNPQGFDENMVLSDALAASGDKSGAQAACAVAKSRIADMEPTNQERWAPILKKKCGP